MFYLKINPDTEGCLQSLPFEGVLKAPYELNLTHYDELQIRHFLYVTRQLFSFNKTVESEDHQLTVIM